MIYLSIEVGIDLFPLSFSLSVSLSPSILPDNGYSHFVMERINHNLSESLFEINGLLAMCDLEQHLIATDHYGEFCVREVMTNECCRPWSIPNYVALLTNKTHCFDIVAEDVAYVQTLLSGCFQFYHNLRLDGDCVNFRCKNVPPECAQFNSVYNIFHFLADNRFMGINVSVPVPGRVSK